MTFKKFYILWYSRMKNFAREYVISEDDAEDIVQDVFVELFEKYDSLNNKVNIVPYIFTTVKNRCIDHLRHKIIAQESADRIQEEHLLTLRMKFDSLSILNEELFQEGDSIETVIAKALESLPEKCRIIFVKHRIDGMKVKEIAKELQIAPKTVENQITIAHKKLRIELQRYLPLLLLLLP